MVGMHLRLWISLLSFLAVGCNENSGAAAEPGGVADSEAAAQEFPTGRPVPGKAGFVFSPYNDKMIDVRGVPPGTIVSDPTFPASEKKHFRVPEPSDQASDDTSGIKAPSM